MNIQRQQVCVYAAIARMMRMQLVGWVAGKQEHMHQWMITHELKELMQRCTSMQRGTFDAYCRRAEQAFSWRDETSLVEVVANQKNYDWDDLISRGLCKHIHVHREVFDSLTTTDVKAVVSQLEEEVSASFVGWGLVLINFGCCRQCGIFWRGMKNRSVQPQAQSTPQQGYGWIETTVCMCWCTWRVSWRPEPCKTWQMQWALALTSMRASISWHRSISGVCMSLRKTEQRCARWDS